MHMCASVNVYTCVHTCTNVQYKDIGHFSNAYLIKLRHVGEKKVSLLPQILLLTLELIIGPVTVLLKENI